MFLRVWFLVLVCVLSASAAPPQVLRRFGRDGHPRELQEGRDGAFYGVSYDKIMRLTPQGGYRVLHEIRPDTFGGIVAAEDGNLYGTEFLNDNAALFRLSYSGRIEYLHEFARLLPDRPVYAHSLVIGVDGAIYGIASSAYHEDPSVVFRASLEGEVTIVASFEGTPFRAPRGLANAHDGALLALARVQDSRGFYGTTVVRITRDGTISSAVANNASVGDTFRIHPHPDGAYYLSGYGLRRLSANGEVTWLPVPWPLQGLPAFLARDGAFYGGAYMPGKPDGTSEIDRVDTTGQITTVVRNLTAPLFQPQPLVQSHTGAIYGVGTGYRYETSFFRWRPPGAEPANLGPYARPDFARPPAAGRSVSIDVLRNDSDVNGDALTIAEVSAPAHGSAVLHESGKRIIYTAPTGGPVAVDEFTYTISDGNGGRGIGRVTLRPDLRGHFTGLLPNADYRRDGRLAVHVSGFGAFSGQLWLGGTRRNFGGVFDSDNRFTASVSSSTDWKIANIDLQVGARGGATFIDATITIDDEVIEQTLTQPNGQAAQAAAGSYTFVIPAKAEWLTRERIFSEAHGAMVEHPLRRAAGDGIGTFRMLANGSAIAAGRLPDGEPFASDFWMDELGRLQIYSSLYKMPFSAPPPAQGWMRGLARFRDVAGQSDADGAMLWNITVPGGGGAPLDREPVNFLASRIVPGTTLEDAFPSGLEVMVGDVTGAPSGTARATGNTLAGNSPLQFNGALLSGNGTLRGHLGNSSAWTTWSGVNFPKQKTVFAQFRRFGRVIWGRPPVGSGALRLTGQ